MRDFQYIGLVLLALGVVLIMGPMLVDWFIDRRWM